MKLYGVMVLVFVEVIPLSAGQYRLAELVGGGNANEGKCTVEVIVDGVAEIRIRANTATLLDLSTQPSQWRSFRCNGVMPVNPLNFQFVGVDGRGRQNLVQSPRSGEAAVVHIEDPGPGSSLYTFILMWNYVLLNGPQSRDPKRMGQNAHFYAMMPADQVDLLQPAFDQMVMSAQVP